eukprot:6029542-Amphidinium_carterae.2
MQAVREHHLDELLGVVQAVEDPLAAEQPTIAQKRKRVNTHKLVYDFSPKKFTSYSSYKKWEQLSCFVHEPT